MEIKRLSKNEVVASIAVLVIICAIIYLTQLEHKSFEQIVVSQTQQQLLAIAKSTARSLEGFIEEHSEALQVLSQNPFFQEEIYKKVLHDKSATVYCPVKNLYEIHKDDIAALTTLDADGIMLHRHPFWANRIGMDHTDKPGVAYVMRERKPYVSEVFYNNLGNPAISISEPVFYKGEFVGIARWMVQIDTILKRLIEPIKVGKEGCPILLDDKGRLLYHPRNDFKGRACYDILAEMKKDFPGHDWSGLSNIIEKRSKGEEGTGLYCGTTTLNEGRIKLTKKLMAYAPIQIGERKWTISIVMPYSEISAHDHRIKTFGLATVAIMLFGASGLALFRSRKRKTELEMKDQLAQSEKLASIGRLAAGVAHEINNPATFVSVNAITMEKWWKLFEPIFDKAVESGWDREPGLKKLPDMLDRFPKMIQSIQAGAARISSITNALREFARPDREKKQLVDLRDILQDAVIMTKNQYKYHADLVIENGTEIPKIFGSSQKLEQVFINLIINATDATKEKADIMRDRGQSFQGLISVIISLRETPEKRVEIVVKDNGIGMGPNVVRKIFDPFFTTKLQNKGTGLGMSIVYGIIQDHGGSISVESTKGEETAFTITLPVEHRA